MDEYYTKNFYVNDQVYLLIRQCGLLFTGQDSKRFELTLWLLVLSSLLWTGYFTIAVSHSAEYQPTVRAA